MARTDDVTQRQGQVSKTDENSPQSISIASSDVETSPLLGLPIGSLIGHPVVSTEAPSRTAAETTKARQRKVAKKTIAPPPGFNSAGKELGQAGAKRGPFRLASDRKDDHGSRIKPAHAAITDAKDEAITRRRKDTPSDIGDQEGDRSGFAFTPQDSDVSDDESDDQADRGNSDRDMNARYPEESCFAKLMGTRRPMAQPTGKRMADVGI